MSAPPEPKEAEELTRLVASMEGVYGQRQVLPEGRDRRGAASTSRRSPEILAEGRDPKRLQEVWEGWHTIAVPMKKDYARFVELSNKGAKALGVSRHRRDVARQVRHAARRLREGARPALGTAAAAVSVAARVRAQPAAREVRRDRARRRARFPRTCSATSGSRTGRTSTTSSRRRAARRRSSLTESLKAKKVGPARDGPDRRAVLHVARASSRCRRRSGNGRCSSSRATARSSATRARGTSTAWTTCASRCASTSTAEDFTTIHHELGHNFYQRAYNKLPMILRDSANDGFHEAVGDTLALSVTPEYLVKIGLLDKAPDASADTGLLLDAALERLAFLPFGLLVDQWRWQVFAGADPAVRLQQGVVGFEAALPGRRAAGAARRGVLRSRRQVPRPGQHAVHALLPRAGRCSSSSIARSPRRPGARRRSTAARSTAAPRRAQRLNAMLEMGASQAVARRARSADRAARDGRERHGRVLRSPQDVAGRAEQGEDRGLVKPAATSPHSGPPCLRT